MAIRALGALATVVILSAASSSWGQESPDADDAAAGSDATFGQDGADGQDGAPGDGDDGGTSSSDADDSGNTVDPVAVPTAPTPTGPPDPGAASDQPAVPQATDNEPTAVDDGASAEAGQEVGPSWGDAAPPAEQVGGLFPREDGCSGCSTGDTGQSGPAVFVLAAALVVAWRCHRRRPRTSRR